ncbi:PP2C family protein-serine/threonine phosphatase [Quadrisphaera sp. DSM 44207]|uniref:PP2C family protein-serine/threonine phosphatase n=1 Tax=Quadrisphaera sp. DSM 44207 TaxID=1881057 RepID=UPI000884B172|nr:PP2C family protein-serine/threonine phosphatase [Quadrisphaera sp. DSM 44207]SDQ06601.1 Stage II sporulation protein E (SpoIIE) [Quadrisphaera sp. DSM 44207]
MIDGPAPAARPDPLRSLLQASHLLSADQLPRAVAEQAAGFGAREVVVYLVDYEQSVLVPLQGEGVPPRQELSIGGTIAGLVYRRVQARTSAGRRGGQRLWLPLLDGVERLGVLEVVLDQVTAELEEEARAYATLVAELVVVNDAYSDAFSRVRRRRTMSLAAEMQWELLPPLSFATDRVVITGALEPAYDIGGDTFDYAVSGDTADLLVLDAIGHGLPAAVLASVAVSAYRHARRQVLDLPDIAAAMDRVIAEQFGPERFATAVIARLDLATGRLRWINAGHPPPLLLRAGALTALSECSPELPLGLQEAKASCCEARLEPGDRVLLHTDGIVEARSPDGLFFGEERLAAFVLRAAAAGDRAPETIRQLMRRILAHQGDQLQDDASIILLEWATGEERRLQI